MGDIVQVLIFVNAQRLNISLTGGICGWNSHTPGLIQSILRVEIHTKQVDTHRHFQYNSDEICIYDMLFAGGGEMAVSYRKLWHLMLDKKVSKNGLERLAGISHYAMLKMIKRSGCIHRGADQNMYGSGL